MTIGFPFGLGDWAVSRGTIGSSDGLWLTLSGAIAEGNSGGPLLRGDKVVAMITSVEGIGARATPALVLRSSVVGWGVEPVGAQAGTEASPPEPKPAPPEPQRAAPPPASPAPGRTFKDCPDCPEMVVVPAGSFTMGSPESEKGRDKDEGPLHQVTIPAAFAVSKYEVTRGQFARFVQATGRDMSGWCYVLDDEANQWTKDFGRSWRDPEFAQSDDHPVVCVSFEDAKAFAEWLAKQTGKPYRLPSEAEWEYAARAKTPTARYWGEGEAQACAYANVADRRGKAAHPGWSWTTFDCDDGYAETAPVGKYQPNAFGLHDMLGNVWEWTQDCWNESYQGAPANGVAWQSGDCGTRAVRGGAWNRSPAVVRSANRGSNDSADRASDLGFRVARTLP